MKARTRLLASFLALLLCLSPVTVWASPEAPRPSHVVDLALSDTAESQLPLREAVAPLGYRQDDWVTVMVELEEEPPEELFFENVAWTVQSFVTF